MAQFRRQSVKTVVDLADNLTVVRVGNAILLGIYVNTVLTATVVDIEETGGANIIILPGDLAAGSQLAWAGLPMNGILVNPDDAATGEIVLEWAPIHN